MQVELKVIGLKTDREKVELTLPAILGRGADVDLVIPHPEISRRHCRLFVHQNMVHVQDLKSLNGTVVGETRLQNAQCMILPGEQFTLGPITFEIQYTKPESPAASSMGSALGSGSSLSRKSTAVPPAELPPKEKN